MGDQADRIIEDMISGVHWGDDDQHDECDVSFLGSRPGFSAPKLITCRYCGTGGFVWKQIKDGAWRLHDRFECGKMHECPALPQAGVDAAKLSLIRGHNRALGELVEALDSGGLMIEHLRPDLLDRLRDLTDVRPPIDREHDWLPPQDPWD